MEHVFLRTPIGKLTVAAGGGCITNVFFEGEEPVSTHNAQRAVHNGLSCENCKGENLYPPDSDAAVLQSAAAQLSEYFRGERKTFDLPVKPAGGAFFRRVWDIMRREIPYGVTISYSALAALAGNPEAARAVGMANNRNPIPIIIPCHRVVGKNGSLTGFRAGVDVKEKLLELERAGQCAGQWTMINE